MSGSSDDYSNASIEYVGTQRGDFELIHVFCVNFGTSKVYFEARFEFGKNGDDFVVVISNFGLHRRTLAGSSYDPLFLKSFEASEVASIRDRLIEYFSGPEEKRFFPFTVKRANFMGVKFSNNWIRVDQTSQQRGL